MIATSYWSALPLSIFRDEFGRFIDRALQIGGQQSVRATSFPTVNLWEDEKNFYAEAELPGVESKDLDITIEGDNLHLRGKRVEPELANGVYHRRERGTGEFHRVVHLPVAIVADGIEAKLRDGVLTLTMPKAPEEVPRKIAIK